MPPEDDFNLGGAVDNIATEMGLDPTSMERPPEELTPVKEGGEVSKEAEGTEKPAEGAADAVVDPADGAAAADTASAAEGPPAPDTWTAEAKAKWAALDAGLKAEIVKREGDYAKGIGQYKQGHDLGARFANTVAPFLPMYQKQGWDVWQVLPSVMNAYQVMVQGTPEQKVQMFNLLAQDAGIDVSALSQGGEVAARTEIARMQQEIQRLQQGVTGVASQAQSARLAELERGVVAFGADKEAHPYFEEVIDEMTRLITTGAAKDLQGAYESAVWTNPATRAKEIARANGDAVKKASDEAAARVNKAKKATAAHVQSSEGGRPDEVLGSIDDTLREAYLRMNGSGA